MGEGDAEPLTPEERAVLRAFDRLRPEGGLEWRFREAMRGLDRPEHLASDLLPPWGGLPADLWERGRAARLGRRLAGDVIAAVGDLLAADARTVASAAASVLEARFVAAAAAVQLLEARVRSLESRLEPTGLVTADLDLPPPDVSEWTESLGGWLGPGAPDGRPVLVGDAGEDGLVEAVASAGHPVRAVEPRGRVVWKMAARRPDAGYVLAETADELAATGEGAAAGVVLAGCLDRADLVTKCAILRDGLRVTASGGRVVLLVVDQAHWDASLAPAARDLLPGRPLHPESWSLLARRSGAGSVTWHRPASGATHALVIEAGG